MGKLGLYPQHKSLAEFVEEYLDKNLRQAIYGDDTKRTIRSDENEFGIVSDCIRRVDEARDCFIGDLQIAIADYLEDYDPVVWPQESYDYKFSYSVNVPGKSNEFNQKVNNELKKYFEGSHGGLSIRLLADLKEKYLYVPELESEKKYNKLEKERNELNKATKVSVVMIFFWLLAIGTLFMLIGYIHSGMTWSVAFQWLIPICALFSWPMAGSDAYTSIKYRKNVANKKARLKQVKQEMTDISRTEEYQDAVRRRREMPERIRRWKEEMRRAIRK